MLHEALHCSKPVLNINRQAQHSQVLMLGTQHQVLHLKDIYVSQLMP